MPRFDDRVVLITGTAGGQGRVAAHAFAAEGAIVLGTDINAEGSAETTRLVRAAGGRMESIEPLDVADPADAERWVADAVARWGRIDVLYNNAAGLRRAGWEDITLADWEFTLRNELTIAFVASKAVWPTMLAQRSGVIVSVASIAGHRENGYFPAAAHGVANAGVIALARTMAVAGAAHGIRSVSLSPGFVNNPDAGSSRSSDPALRTFRDRVSAAVPMRRSAEMDEIVKAAMWLASDDASYVTGVDLLVDGGQSGSIHMEDAPRGDGLT